MKLLDRWTFLLLLVVGVWMTWAASHYTVFDDEAFSAQRYVLPLDEMLRALWQGVEPDPPLYYVLQNVWLRFVGLSPLALRSLSIVLFLAGLFALRAAAQAWFDRSTARAALLLSALHPAHLFFGFAARWYAAMFLCVAVLLWTTKRLADAGGNGGSSTTHPTTMDRGKWIIAWAAAAAAVCYTNYFGPVVVGLVWMASIVWNDDRRRWLIAGTIAALLYLPWMVPFWRQALAFPRADGEITSYLACAARTLMALCAGNLASHRAGYVWTPMLLFAIALLVLLFARWKDVRLLAFVFLGCFFAGVLSRVMIDKYVLTFSGPACLLVAALVVHGLRDAHPPRRRAAKVAAVALALAWVGCGFDLVTGRNWSSLRWHDPFESVIGEWLNESAAQPPTDWVLTHPSARYYLSRACAVAPMPPRDALVRIRAKQVSRLLTLETAEFADAADWNDLRAVLSSDYENVIERTYLEDPDAAWKDRLDPHYKHPRWRITVRLWAIKPGAK